jgi:hypothetical protein
MSADELADFLATRPSGATCVVDDGGRLVAVPALVLDRTDDGVRIELVSAHLDATFDQRHGCVVADSFESYDEIRGVIIRGTLARTGATVPDEYALREVRITTFNFAEHGDGSSDPGA